MSGTLVALLATAIYQARNTEGDPVILDRTLSLLARAAEGEPVVLATTPEGIMTNGVLLTEPAPGVALLSEALATHDTSRLQLPGGMEPRHWRDVAEIFAAAPVLFPTAGHVLAALRTSLPTAEIWGRTGTNNPVAAAAWTETPTDPDNVASEAGLTSRAGYLGTFSAELSLLNEAGTAAAQQEDPEELARVLLGFHELERSDDPAQASVVAKERRRVVTPAVLDWLIGIVIRPGGSASVVRALGTLGREEIHRILEAQGHAASSRERDALAQVFDHIGALPALIFAALEGGGPTDLIQGAADIAGRRQMTGTISVLARLLRHGDAEVRTAAWRALEQIGTVEAIEALSAKGR